MSAYRQSSYDPNAYEQPGRPLKPFNWVQWTGVAVMAIGAALLVASLLGWIGWIPQWMKEFSPAPFMLMVLGMFLINSRREPGSHVGSEHLAKNRKVLIITVAICAAILGAALAIEFSGVI